MAGGYDNNGNYARWYSWQADDVAGVGIVSDRHDTEDNEFMKALNVAFLRDGRAPATADWNMAGKIIHNLGTATTPADGDAVNYGMLTGSGSNGTPDFKKAINITGADINGRLNFKSATGVNGIGWFGADLGWFARIDDPNKVRPRLVLNNLWNGGLPGTPGVDVVTLDDAGNVDLTSITSNLSLDSAGLWRATVAGWCTRLVMNDTGMTLQGTNTATVTDPYVLVTLQDRIVFNSYNGSATIALHKKDGTATGGLNALYGYTGPSSLRWVMQLGTSLAEGSGDVGTEFALTAFTNAGASKFTVMSAGRNDGKVNFPQGHAGVLLLDNGIDTVGAVAVLGGAGGVYLRPNGRASSTGQAIVSTAGDLTVGRYLLADGITERNGTSGSNGASHYNFNYVPGLQAWIDNTNLGTISITCDYRIKKDIKPLASTWNKVKALRPVSYTPRGFSDGETMLSQDSDEERWGFLAHELQESLLPSAAEGAKDEEHRLQSPNLMAVVAALTAALQEAQLRIEALEARLAA